MNNLKGTEVSKPRRSSARDCTCVLTKINHPLMDNSSMTFALELIWNAFRYQFIPNCQSSNLFQQPWAYLSEPLVRHRHLVTIYLRQKSKAQYLVLQVDHILPICTCYGEVYRNIAQEENGWLNCGELI